MQHATITKMAIPKLLFESHKQFILLATLVFGFFAMVSYAQPTVLVNGVRLDTFDNTTISGIDYVAVDELSEAIGANLNSSDTSLQLELAGEFVLMQIFSTVQEAKEAETAIELRRFGESQQLESTGALRVGEELLVPLKSVVRAFGGSVDYVTESNSVIAVFERAQLIVLAYPRPNSSVERFVFNLSVPVNYKIQDMKSLSVFNILFAQTSSQLGSQTMTGKGFQKALFRDFAGDVEFRLELRPGYKADIFSSPPVGEFAGYRGVNVIVDVLADEAFDERYAVAAATNNISDTTATVVSSIGAATDSLGASSSADINDQVTDSSVSTNVVPVSSIGSTPPVVVSSIGSNTSSSSASATVNVAGKGGPVNITARSSLIVLDPAPVATANLTQSDTSFDFVALLAGELQRNGYSSSITRAKGDTGNLESRRNAGVGAAAFISLNQTDIPSGTYNLYYLGEAESLETLNLAVRRNAERELSNSSSTASSSSSTTEEAETAALRRKVLLNLSSGVDEAETLAQSLSRTLSTNGYQLRNIQSAPLYILGGAVGKGVVVEVSSQDINNPKLRSALLESILQLQLQ